MTETPGYIKTPTGFVMVLKENDDVLNALAKMAESEKIPSASFIGMGFAQKIVFGFFDFDRRTYDPMEFNDVELASLTGSIAWNGGEPSLHVHAVAAGSDFKAVGGHVLELMVGTGSMEITFLVHDKKLNREKDARIGANVLSLG